MSVENMTSMSYLLFGISGVSAMTAAVLFFVLDIAKCWRMVSGKYPVCRERRLRTDSAEAARTEQLRSVCTEKISGSEAFASGEETLPLEERFVEEMESAEETTLLSGHADSERTELLDTKPLEIVQDIVYVHDAAEPANLTKI